MTTTYVQTIKRGVGKAAKPFQNPVLSSVVATLLAAAALNLVTPFRELMFRPLSANALLILLVMLIVAALSSLATSILFGRKFRAVSNEYEETIGILEKDLAEVTDVSVRDRLTRAYNSNQIEPILARRMEEARREDKTFVLILADIDGFKKINDDYEHEVGNFVLRQFAREITPRSSGDTLIRYGGDEFLIVSQLGTNAASGHGFAERLRREVGEFEFLVEENSSKRERLTISCGVTEFIPDQDDRKTLLSRVAKALHLAKQPRTASDGSTHAKNFVYVLSGAVQP